MCTHREKGNKEGPTGSKRKGNRGGKKATVTGVSTDVWEGSRGETRQRKKPKEEGGKPRGGYVAEKEFIGDVDEETRFRRSPIRLMRREKGSDNREEAAVS